MKFIYYLIGTTTITLIGITSPQQALALSFSFSFSNIDGTLPPEVPGNVTGLIEGLEEGTGPATKIIIIDSPISLIYRLPFIATDLSDQIANTFTVVDGELVNATFVASDQATVGIIIDTTGSYYARADLVDFRDTQNIETFTDTLGISLVFRPVESSTPVPEPLTLLGTATALGFSTLFKRKLGKK